MNEERKKEGVSVKELESYAKRHRFEIFFCLLLVIASLFTLIFWGPTLSIFLLAAGGIVSLLMPKKIEAFSVKIGKTIFSKDKTTQLIIGIALMVIALFLAPLIFLLIGLQAGKGMLFFTQNHTLER